MTPLRDTLLDAYGGFADRRIKDRDLDRAIKIDDRHSADVDSRFCSIFVSVPDRRGEALRLTLLRAPSGPEVVELVEKLGGTVHRSEFGSTITLTLKSSQAPAVRRLAAAIRAMVGRGLRYDDPNLKWICPRTAASLVRLAEHLAFYREELWPDEPLSRGPSPDSRSRSGVRVMVPGSPILRPDHPARHAGPGSKSH